MAQIELSQETRDQIRAEEVFREEIRAELALQRAQTSKRPSFWQRLWTFLNSQVGGWILSAVLIGSVGFAYAQWVEYRSERADRGARREKIAIEVEFRIQMYEDRRSEGLDRAREALDGSLPPHGIYPEFQERLLATLLWELVHVCDDDDRKKYFRADAATFSGPLATGADFEAKKLEEGVKSLKRAIAELLPEG